MHETARFAPALFDPGPDARHDWQILLGLARRVDTLRLGSDLRRTLKYRALERLGPERILDVGLRLGRFGARLRPPRVGLTLAKVREAVHGVDLGPLTPSLPERLFRREKRIDLAPPLLVAALARLWAAFEGEGATRAPGSSASPRSTRASA